MLTPRLAHPVYTSIVVTDSSPTVVDVIRHICCLPVTAAAAAASSIHHRTRHQRNIQTLRAQTQRLTTQAMDIGINARPCTKRNDDRFRVPVRVYL